MSVSTKQRNETVSVNVVTSYCLPKLVYGCESWPVAKMNLSELDIIWNDAYRRINCCLRERVQFFCNNLPLSYVVDERRLVLYRKLLAHNNTVLWSLELSAVFCEYYNDWQSLKKKWNFSAITGHIGYFVTENFEELICRVIHWSQRLHCDWKEQICHGQLRVLLTFPGGSHFHYLSSSTSCWQQRKTAVVLMTVTSHTKRFQECHGIWVILSCGLPSLCIRPTGFFVSGTPAYTKAWVTRSFRCWCLAILLGACLWTRLCWPRASTVPALLQVWGDPRFKPKVPQKPPHHLTWAHMMLRGAPTTSPHYEGQMLPETVPSE